MKKVMLVGIMPDDMELYTICWCYFSLKALIDISSRLGAGLSLLPPLLVSLRIDMCAEYNPRYEQPDQEILECTLIVSARGGYSIKGLKDLGYRVEPPYKKASLAKRVIREGWFKLGLPEGVWYADFDGAPRDIIVHDPLITRNFLFGLQRRFPEARIHYLYWNLVGRARHLLPNDVPDFVTKWTYDKHDAEKYGLRLLDSLGYPTMYMRDRKVQDIDLLFVGSDKGRAGTILGLRDRLERDGFKVDFRIMPDGRFSRRRSFYSDPMDYEEIADLIAHSKAVLNVCLPGQTGATLRDYESAFNGIKLVTNNSNVVSFPFYKPENVLLLDAFSAADLRFFLDTPFTPIEGEVLKKCTLNAHIEQIVKSSAL